MQLPIDQIDILIHFIPNDQETKAFANYLNQGKDIKNLSDEDQFLFAVISRFFKLILVDLLVKSDFF